MPENLHVEDIRGLIRFGREFRDKPVMLQFGGFSNQVLTFEKKKEEAKLGIG